MVVVFAAGNEARDIDRPHEDSVNGFATDPDVIAVAASTSMDERADYSNFGAAVHVCAPSSGIGGSGITTADVTGEFSDTLGFPRRNGYVPGDYNEQFGKTSSACPLVAGVCGLILSVNPGLTALEVREIIKSTARKIGAASDDDANGHSKHFGYGCIDAEAAVSKAMSALPVALQPRLPQLEFVVRRDKMLFPRVLGMLALALSIAPFDRAAAQSPSQEPQDASEAINNPDRYAWRLFVALNWPADLKQKSPDASKPFGAPGPVVLGDLAQREERGNRYGFPEKRIRSRSLAGERRRPRRSRSRRWTPNCNAADNSSRNLEAGQRSLASIRCTASTRKRDKTEQGCTYEFIRQNKLFNLDAQLQLFKEGRKTIDFPLRAKEIKARWVVIADTEEEKRRYHWTQGSDGKIYGLTALHIITKDLPNWFWTTFEHIDNKKPESAGGRTGNVGWHLPSRDRVACPQSPYDCDLAPTGLGLQGTKWENYRLRGTQIDFVDSRGNATVLANSQPEAELSTDLVLHHVPR